MTAFRDVRLLLLALLLLIMYTLPWLDGGSRALALGAYDLAEWTSLHPAVRGQSPPLLTTLLLRLPLACVAVWVAWWPAPARLWGRLVQGLIALLLTAALLPPLDFFTNSADVNYRQQFMLAVLTLAAVLPGLSLRLARARWGIAALALLLAAASAAAGTTQAASLFDALGLAPRVSAAVPAFASLCLLLSWAATGWRKNKQGSPL